MLNTSSHGLIAREAGIEMSYGTFNHGLIAREAGIEMSYGIFNLERDLSKLQLSERWQYVVPD